MRILVSTCDKYDYLLPGFAWCFNKYWPGQQVDVVGYRQAPRLPSNFVFHPLNPVEDKPFTAYLHKYVASLMDNHLVFLFDDYWLTEPVDTQRVAFLESLILTPGVDADKADLSTNTHYFQHNAYKYTSTTLTTPSVYNLYEASQDAQYRSSTQPAIWKRRHFLHLLNPKGHTPWQFEIENPSATRDGARILGLDIQTYVYANVVHKGAADWYAVNRLGVADKQELFKMGYTNINDNLLNFNQFKYREYMQPA